MHLLLITRAINQKLRIFNLYRHSYLTWCGGLTCFFFCLFYQNSWPTICKRWTRANCEHVTQSGQDRIWSIPAEQSKSRATATATAGARICRGGNVVEPPPLRGGTNTPRIKPSSSSPAHRPHSPRKMFPQQQLCSLILLTRSIR